jgi:deoxycytidylate deaminase
MGRSTLSQFVELAERVAEKSHHKFHKHGCVIYKNGKVLATGFNRMFNKRSIHAENDALSKIRNIKGCKMIVVRKGLKMSKPCLHCQPILNVSRKLEIIRYSVGVE